VVVWQRVMVEAPLGDLLKLLAVEAGNFPETAQWLKESVVRPGKNVLTGIVAAGIASGEFRPLKADIVADIFASPLCLYALRDVWGELSSPDRFLEDAFDMLPRGLGAASAESLSPRISAAAFQPLRGRLRRGRSTAAGPRSRWRRS